MTNFQEAIKFVLKWEAGYVNNPTDPGGETNFGISKRKYPAVDIKNLTVAGAMEIYKRDYWDLFGLDKFSLPDCVAVLDAYVQHRPEVVKGMIDKTNGAWKGMITARRDFYGRLVMQKPSLQVFLKGWTNRLNDLSKTCQGIKQAESTK